MVENGDYVKTVEFNSKSTIGLEPALNWSLSSNHIHPQYEAYGNTKLENLLKNAYGKKDAKNQTLIVETFKTPKFDKFVLKKPKQVQQQTETEEIQEQNIEWEKDIVDFSEIFSKRVLKEVKNDPKEVFKKKKKNFFL